MRAILDWLVLIFTFVGVAIFCFVLFFVVGAYLLLFLPLLVIVWAFVSVARRLE